MTTLTCVFTIGIIVIIFAALFILTYTIGYYNGSRDAKDEYEYYMPEISLNMERDDDRD